MRFSRALALLAALAIPLAGARAAAAEPTPADKAVAEGLFQESKRLMNAGDYAAACPKLAESERLVPKLGTLLNLATCHEKIGLTASAWAEFTQAATLAGTTNQAERQRYARTHADALEKTLSRLTLEIAEAPPGLSLELDGRALGPGAWQSPIPVDPGEHRVTASAPGRTPWSTTVRVAPAAASTAVHVPALTRAEGAPAAGAPVDGKSRTFAPEATPAHGSSTSTILGFTAIGVGAIGIGVGTVFGIKTFAAKNDSAPHCTGTLCDATGVELRANGKTYATVSTITFAAGVAFAAAGVVLVVLRPGARSGDVAVTASVGPSGGELAARASW